LEKVMVIENTMVIGNAMMIENVTIIENVMVIGDLGFQVMQDVITQAIMFMTNTIATCIVWQLMLKKGPFHHENTDLIIEEILQYLATSTGMRGQGPGKHILIVDILMNTQDIGTQGMKNPSSEMHTGVNMDTPTWRGHTEILAQIVIQVIIVPVPSIRQTMSQHLHLPK
jgi:hypothetical protein